MDKWEYVIIEDVDVVIAGLDGSGIFQVWQGKRQQICKSDDVALADIFNKLGTLGWELTTSSVKFQSPTWNKTSYVFKRPNTVE